jgi:hypothetical protein
VAFPPVDRLNIARTDRFRPGLALSVESVELSSALGLALVEGRRMVLPFALPHSETIHLFP